MPPNFKKYFQKLEESAKDPFLYLGIAAVLLFLIISFYPSGFVSKPQNRQEVFLIENFSQNPFIGPARKTFAEAPDFLLVGNSSLRSAIPPVMITPQVLGMWLGEEGAETGREITEYIVEEGDSLWAIASQFNISLETIVWANNLKTLIIQPGQTLLILPVSGVMHLVQGGDTLAGLAEKYKTETEKIIAFNDLAGESDIMVDEVLIIPDGKLPSISIIQPVDSGTSAQLSTNNFYGQSHAYPWGQCTWWVAQKRPIPSWGNAKDWLDNAIRSGYAVCKGSWCIPQVGAVISVKTSNPLGHVAYVEEVRGDKVIFSETNYIGLGKMDYRTLRVGSPSIKGYIY